VGDMTILRRGAVAAVVITALVCGLSFERVADVGLQATGTIAIASAEAQEAPSPAQETKKAPTPYDVDVKALTTAECGQCHFPIFNTIKEQGGKHQFDCVRCHTQYHVYNPRKQNYDQIMPKCASCHVSASGGPFHGENKKITQCLTCHADPHKPKAIPMAKIEPTCAICHSKVGNQIKKYPSKHTSDVTCTDCHAEKHGYIPECSACHESHSPEVEMASADCMVCHPVHKPTQIKYSEETLSTICAGCHGKAYNLLQKKETKHTILKCAACHPAHGEILPCSECHGQPHSKGMMKGRKNCGECHSIAHDLLM
jgi:predicted CXXCH cytochrome family protein